MRGKIRWLDMESRKDREKREKRYEQQMFPMGERQKAAELALLEQVVRSVKPQDALYQLLQVREILINETDEGERQAQLREWRDSRLARKLSDADVSLLIRLVPRIRECEDMETFPTAAEVLGWRE